MNTQSHDKQIDIPVDISLWMFENMVVSRSFEETIKSIYFEGKSPLFNMAKGPIPGEMHLSSGQEPCAVGVCAHLRASDAVTATHRPHHIAIAKGVDINRMAAEIFGKAEGLSGGRGGHMHIFDSAVNFSCSGIIAQGMAPAVGYGLAAQFRGKDDIAVSFIGDGAANQGAFHESLNLAATWNIPVVFVIEDNRWGISVEKSSSAKMTDYASRASAYGMPGFRVPQNDPNKVYEVAGQAIERARAGQGPTLIEIETVRMEGHFIGDSEAYRPKAERSNLKTNDPIPRYRDWLLKSGVVNEDALRNIERLAREKVDTAISYARQGSLPAPETALTCITL